MRAAISAALVVCSLLQTNAQSLDDKLQQLVDQYGEGSVSRAVQRLGLGSSTAQSTQPVTSTAPPEPQKATLAHLGGFLLRRSYTDYDATADPLDDLKGARPAEFSYAHDFLDDNNQWSAHLSVLRPINLWQGDPITGRLSPTALLLVPSVTFDRVSNSASQSKRVDSLAFRAGIFSQFIGTHMVRMLEARGFVSYTTNSSFDGGVVAGEFDLEPGTSLRCNDRFEPLLPSSNGAVGPEGSLIEAKWRLYLHSEGGAVAGSPAGKHEHDDFFRVGPVAELALDPFLLRRMSLITSYSYLAGLSGSPSASHHLTVGLHWALDEEKHWALSLTYEDGSAPLVADRGQTFLASVGVKY